MKIGGFLKNSFLDYPGQIACVIFTSGCNYNCWYCHNSEIIDKNLEAVCSEKNVFEYIGKNIFWLDGIVISGGEPTIQKDLKDFIIKIKSFGLKVKLDTNGTNDKMLKELIDEGLIDYVAMDIKTDLKKYSEITRVAVQEETIMHSINILKEDKVDYEFRTTFAPNISLEDIAEVGKVVNGAKAFYLQKYVYHYGQTEMILHTKDAYLNAVEILSKYVGKVELRGF